MGGCNTLPWLSIICIRQLICYPAPHLQLLCFPLTQGHFFSKSTTSLDLSRASTFDACTTSRCIQWLRDTQGWSQEGCPVFIVCSALHITHSIQLLWTFPWYMSYICIALTIGWFDFQHKLVDHTLDFLCGALNGLLLSNVSKPVYVFSLEKLGFCVKISRPNPNPKPYIHSISALRPLPQPKV